MVRRFRLLIKNAQQRKLFNTVTGWNLHRAQDITI